MYNSKRRGKFCRAEKENAGHEKGGWELRRKNFREKEKAKGNEERIGFPGKRKKASGWQKCPIHHKKDKKLAKRPAKLSQKKGTAC